MHSFVKEFLSSWFYFPIFSLNQIPQHFDCFHTPLQQSWLLQSVSHSLISPVFQLPHNSVLSQAAAPHLKKTSGVVVNVADIIGERPVPSTMSVYAISKAAIIMVTKSLALELAPEVNLWFNNNNTEWGGAFIDAIASSGQWPLTGESSRKTLIKAPPHVAFLHISIGKHIQSWHILRSEPHTYAITFSLSLCGSPDLGVLYSTGPRQLRKPWSSHVAWRHARGSPSGKEYNHCIHE